MVPRGNCGELSKMESTTAIRDLVMVNLLRCERGVEGVTRVVLTVSALVPMIIKWLESEGYTVVHTVEPKPRRSEEECEKADEVLAKFVRENSKNFAEDPSVVRN